jgi:hypothetical protein
MLPTRSDGFSTAGGSAAGCVCRLPLGAAEPESGLSSGRIVSRRFARRSHQQGPAVDAAEALLAPLLDLAGRDDRRIASWSPAVGEHDPVVPDEPPAPPQPAPPPSTPAGPAVRTRGRPPRSKPPRRQVHFHVDEDEERLLLSAARDHGSQQKGIVAALRALQENELLRDEIDRLRAECDRQRQLLVQAESLFER